MRGLADKGWRTLQPNSVDIPRGPELFFAGIEVIHPSGPIISLDIGEGTGTTAVADAQEAGIGTEDEIDNVEVGRGRPASIVEGCSTKIVRYLQ